MKLRRIGVGLNGVLSKLPRDYTVHLYIYTLTLRIMLSTVEEVFRNNGLVSGAGLSTRERINLRDARGVYRRIIYKREIRSSFYRVNSSDKSMSF